MPLYGRRVQSSERWLCREAIHCDRLLEQQQQPSRKLGNVISFTIVQSAGTSAKDAKFVSGFVSVCGSCVAFDKYSFDNGVRGYFLGPIHVRSHADPLQRGVLCKPQGLTAGTPLYGVVVPAVGRRGCFRFDSAVVAPELAFFLDALPRGIEYVHANRDKFFFPDGRGELFAAACLLMRDSLTVVHECLPQDKRPPSHRPLNLEVPPVHFAALLSCFCGSGDVFARFSRALAQRARCADPTHLNMLKIHLPSTGQDVLLTSQCITSFAEAQRTEADDRRAALLRVGRAVESEEGEEGEEGEDVEQQDCEEDCLYGKYGQHGQYGQYGQYGANRHLETEQEQEEEVEELDEVRQYKRNRREERDNSGNIDDSYDEDAFPSNAPNMNDAPRHRAYDGTGRGGEMWRNDVMDVESEGSGLDE